MASIKLPTTLTISLPSWIMDFVNAKDWDFSTSESRMQFVIQLAKLNVEHKTGGPFAAAVFENRNDGLVSVGVNRVVPEQYSVAHAEIMALLLAQKNINEYTLRPECTCELVSSTEPCAMCLGAIAWSGIGACVFGARDEDARQIGFDEGDKPENWQAKLEKRNIKVTTDVCRKEAVKVLQEYKEGKGLIYNA